MILLRKPTQLHFSNRLIMRCSTWIFTLDSLGSRHPQAQKVLRYWLKAEAKDKQQLDEVRLAEVKLAQVCSPVFQKKALLNAPLQVPSQPNFADCGVYLLHFAKTFLSNPVHYFNLVHQVRILPSSRFLTLTLAVF